MSQFLFDNAIICFAHYYYLLQASSSIWFLLLFCFGSILFVPAQFLLFLFNLARFRFHFDSYAGE